MNHYNSPAYKEIVKEGLNQVICLVCNELITKAHFSIHNHLRKHLKNNEINQKQRNEIQDKMISRYKRRI